MLVVARDGKTTFMAELMENQGEIVAWDLHEHRVKLVENTAKRLEIGIIKTKVRDATIYEEKYQNTFDKILLDVPCLGLGVIKRKPDIRWKRKKEEIEEISKIQKEILQTCSGYLKVGGELVYSTCSILKEENEMVLPKIKKELYSKYCEFKKKFNNKRVLGVLFRGTDYANLKPYAHNIQPDLDSMVEMVKQKMLEWENFDLIYLCTEVQEACERFEDEFGKEKICYYPQLRYKSHTKKYLAEVNNDAKERVSQGKDYLVALNCLASCHSLIAGQCSGTEVALMINNNQYKNKYLFKLGKYGIDDI